MQNERNIGFELRRVHHIIHRRIENSTVKQQLERMTGVHGWIVAYLCDHDGEEIFQRDLEQRFSIRRSTATTILQLMEKNGVITREPVPYDARLKKLCLTQQAKELHDVLHQDFRQIEESLRAGLSDAELDAFFATLDKIRQNAEQGL